MKDLFNRLLEYYSITEKDFEELTKDINPQSFVNSYSFDCIRESVSLVQNAIENSKKIIIYGDYDADGIMGTSILAKLFQYLDYPVTYYIPSRYKDGYGINVTQAERIIKDNFGLVICVDNGISANEPIKLLREHNIDVLVLDHHEIPDELPMANAIMHPKYSNLGDFYTSGASVAFFFSIYMLKRFDKYLSTLASISIISDMMPLKGYNRDLLRIVFSRYQEGEFRQIDLLKGNDTFDENTIGMSIAPKINSVGRIVEDNSVNDIVEYFITTDSNNLLTYFNWIEELNDIRKQASKTASENSFSIDEKKKSIVVVVEEKEGLIGLLANSLMNRYKKPTIVFTYNNEQNILKGSCRSLDGFDVVKAFNSLSDILVAFGGHSLAGGCSIKQENLMEFENRFEALANDYPIIFKEKDSIPFSITEISFENYELIKKFSPFGEGWKKPIFNLENIRTESLKFSKDHSHIITQIGTNSKITGFNISKDSLRDSLVVSFIGSLRISSYKGIKNIEFLVNEVKK